MVERANSLLFNKSSTAAIVAKSVKILTAIESCACPHCLNLLKGALSEKENVWSGEPTQNQFLNPVDTNPKSTTIGGGRRS